MTIIDVNILVYAHNADAPEHAVSAAWLDEDWPVRKLSVCLYP
ncbi:MAG TPA: hypothetical protein VLW65_18535 [Bryobacteraceae bacterium]|nr:hypothetical protein [Bryobacteraceae bacterium]